ncbi:MAG TPA: DUF4175 family protein [candidate division Zixibacteria bacterium]|nr:DUF4175 family protein [candidate division Zixibacteria bacterium]
MGQEEFRELSEFLGRFTRRLKLVQGAEGLCLTAICALLLFGAGPAVAALADFFPYAPLLYWALGALVLLFLLGRTLARLLRRPSRERAARYIEEKRPELRNNLINSLQLYPRLAESPGAQGFSPAMVLALLRTTRRQLAALRLDELIDARNLKAQVRLLGLVFVPVLAMVLLDPSRVGETFSLLARPLDHLPPSVTVIHIEPKGARLVRGAPLRIQATTSGAIPRSLQLRIERAGAPGAEEGLPMESLGEGKFAIAIPKLDHTIRYRAVAGSFSSPVYTAEAIEPPEIANVRVTVYPPAYTGLGAVTAPGGDAEGLKGSTIRIDAVTTRQVVKAEIVTEDGKTVPLKIEGRELQGSLVLFQPQRYRVTVEDVHGFRNAPITYELKVRPDGFPTVDLLAPTEDLEVSGDEVLALEYSARDDFGIGRIDLAVEVGERRETIRLQSDDARRLVLRDRFRWDLSRLGLRQGDEARFHLEVRDNDTISGPKLGTSRTLRLKLKDLRGEHQQVAEIVRDLNARMMDMLADHLESPAEGARDRREALEKKLDEALQRTEEALQRVEKDRLSDFATWSDLEALKKNLQFTRDELLERHARAAGEQERLKARDEIATELERMSLLSEEIGKRMQARELASTAQDLARSQERLLDALEKLQSGDPNLDGILKQISELGKLLQSLQQALSQFAQQLPDDFMNPESLRGLGFDQMFSALDEIRKKLLAGDLEGARQLARELFNQMAAMVAALQQSQRSAMASSMGRMQGEMGRSQSELQQIAREQQEILMETEALNNSALRERDDLLKEKLDRFLGRAKEDLGRLTELFPDREGGETGDAAADAQLDDATMNHLVKNLIARLLDRDFPGYAEGEQLARRELAKRRAPAQEGKARDAERTLNRLKGELDALLGEPLRALNDSEKQQLRELARRQELLRERTRELHEKLESLFQLFPALDPKILQNIDGAAGSMGAARERLGGLDARNAVPPERDALDRLTQSQQQMQSAMQQLAQRGQLGNMPATMVFRRGRFLPYGMLAPLPGMPEFPEFNVEGGVTGLETERFRLPGKDDYKAPRSFREEILESLKQGIPPQHKEQIERYFRNLTE